MAGPGDAGLHGLHHAEKELVGNALDHHKDGVGVLFFQLLGVGIQLEAALPGRVEDGLAGLFADVGLVVEDTGHGAHGIPRAGGQVFDGHVLSPTLETFPYLATLYPNFFRIARPFLPDFQVFTNDNGILPVFPECDIMGRKIWKLEFFERINMAPLRGELSAMPTEGCFFEFAMQIRRGFAVQILHPSAPAGHLPSRGGLGYCPTNSNLHTNGEKYGN